MVASNGFEVYVTVDGNRLREFDDGDDNPEGLQSFTKYLEVTSGAVFVLNFKTSRPFRARGDFVGHQIYLDGKYIDHFVYSKRVYRSGFEYSLDGVHRAGEDGSATKRSFAFDDIETSTLGLYESFR